ncbi:FkbM family methyltransferase [Pseudomonas sp. PB120]|uniref:FkbM family methyltransferase n=1 Tax=Pseudomonas sp. PB120 TaxID=2494700 RepID=UPI0012FD9580|nr:FkbM family methyltransferase [Pseudomonas sp. PB120]
MGLTKIAPFRQIAGVYSALLGIAASLQNISARAGQEAVNEQLLAINSSIQELSSVAKRALPPETPLHDVSIYEVNGFRLLLDRSSLVDRLVVEQGEWEGEQVRYLMKLSELFRGRSNPVFLDLGSYWGYYSLMLQSTGIFERVYAFDADAYNFAQLQANIFLNKLDGVIVAQHAAVSDAAGVVTVQNSRSHDDGNRGATRILGESEVSSSGSSRTVKAIAVDDVLDIRNSHVVIKMDVEAHEDRALLGMKNIIANNKVIVQVEIYKEQAGIVVPVLESLGLRQVCAMYPDFFYSNLSDEELAI